MWNLKDSKHFASWNLLDCWKILFYSKKHWRWILLWIRFLVDNLLGTEISQLQWIICYRNEKDGQLSFETKLKIEKHLFSHTQYLDCFLLLDSSLCQTLYFWCCLLPSECWVCYPQTSRRYLKIVCSVFAQYLWHYCVGRLNKSHLCKGTTHNLQPEHVISIYQKQQKGSKIDPCSLQSASVDVSNIWEIIFDIDLKSPIWDIKFRPTNWLTW